MKSKIKGFIAIFALVVVFAGGVSVYAARSTNFNSQNGSNYISGNARISKITGGYNLTYNVHVRGVSGIYGTFQMQGDDGMYAVNKTFYYGDYLNRSAFTGASTIHVKARINGASSYVSYPISY